MEGTCTYDGLLPMTEREIWEGGRESSDAPMHDAWDGARISLSGLGTRYSYDP